MFLRLLVVLLVCVVLYYRKSSPYNPGLAHDCDGNRLQKDKPILQLIFERRYCEVEFHQFCLPMGAGLAKNTF